MNPTQHPSNNRVLGAPKDWSQGQLPCSALAVTDVNYSGHAAVASFWRPTEEELTQLRNGGVVMLTVFGSTMPPVSLTTTLPF